MAFSKQSSIWAEGYPADFFACAGSWICQEDSGGPLYHRTLLKPTSIKLPLKAAGSTIPPFWMVQSCEIRMFDGWHMLKSPFLDGSMILRAPFPIKNPQRFQSVFSGCWNRPSALRSRPSPSSKTSRRNSPSTRRRGGRKWQIWSSHRLVRFTPGMREWHQLISLMIINY